MRARISVTALALLIGAFAASAANAQRQQPSQEELKARYEKKLKKEFLQKASWFTDYDEARAEAKAKGKLILTYFTRSYSP